MAKDSKLFKINKILFILPLKEDLFFSNKSFHFQIKQWLDSHRKGSVYIQNKIKVCVWICPDVKSQALLEKVELAERAQATLKN